MIPAKKTATNATIWNKNFICVALCNLLLCVAHWSVNTQVATYVTFLGATPVIMGLLTGMFFGISLAIRPVSGPMVTKLDKRMLMILIFALGGVVNIGYALFHSIPAFVAFRFLNGVQYSFVGSLLMTAAGDSLPPEKLASGMGFYGIGGAVGTAAGPAIGVGLYNLGLKLGNSDLGFTLVFLFAAVTFLLAVIPSVIAKPDRKTKEDVASTGAWYKNILTVHALPSTLVMFFVLIGYSLFNTYILNFAKEQNIQGIQWFYTIMAGVLIISRPMSGFLTDRFGVAKIVIPGLVLFALSFFIVGISKSLEMVLLGAIVAAIGVGSTQPAIQAMCIQSVTPLKRGVASNTIYIGMDLGLFAGPLLGSVVYKYSSYAVMFRSAVVPIVIGLICFIGILPIYRRQLNALAEATGR
jgi:MFS family permease